MVISKPLFLALSLLSLCLYAASAQNQQTCQVLALAGGGDKGSYQAGAILGLVSNAVDPNNVQYDVITGVSIGAINGAILTQYPKGQESTMAQSLVNIWSKLSSADIYQEYNGGIVYSILFQPSIYDTSPGRKFLAQYVTQAAVRPLVIGTVNADTGEYVTFNESLSYPDLIEAVLCSSAMPAIFPYQEFQGNTYVDGGTIRNLDIGAGILRCRDLGFDDAQIVVDAILLASASLDNINLEGYTTLQVAIRTFEIISYKSDVGAIATAKSEFPGVQFRYLLEPSQKLPSGAVPIGFQPDQLATMIEIGKQDAAAVIGLGEGVSFDRAIAKATEMMKKDGTYIDPVKYEKLKQQMLLKERKANA